MELSCNCGYKVQGSDPYKMQGEMWYHAVHDHSDLLQQMSVEQMAQILHDHANKLGIAKK